MNFNLTVTILASFFEMVLEELGRKEFQFPAFFMMVKPFDSVHLLCYPNFTLYHQRTVSHSLCVPATFCTSWCACT